MQPFIGEQLLARLTATGCLPPLCLLGLDAAASPLVYSALHILTGKSVYSGLAILAIDKQAYSLQVISICYLPQLADS